MSELVFLVVAIMPVATICHGEISTQTYMQGDKQKKIPTRCK